MDDSSRFVLGQIRDRAAAGYGDLGMGIGDAAEDVDVLLEIIDDLTGKVTDMQFVFDLGYQRMGEAAERWRAEVPDVRARVMPDLGRLLEWLMADADRWKGLGAKVMYVLLHEWPDNVGWPTSFRDLQEALHAARESALACAEEAADG